MTKTAKSRAASRTKRPPLKPGGPSRWDTSWKGSTRTAKGRWRVVELKGTFILRVNHRMGNVTLTSCFVSSVACEFATQNVTRIADDALDRRMDDDVSRIVMRHVAWITDVDKHAGLALLTRPRTLTCLPLRTATRVLEESKTCGEFFFIFIRAIRMTSCLPLNSHRSRRRGSVYFNEDGVFKGGGA